MNRKVIPVLIRRILLGAIVLCVFFGGVLAGAASAGQATPNPCPRFQPGSNVTQPPDLFSRDGVLEVNLNYYTTVDPTISGLDPQPNPVPPPLATGLQQFCFATPDGAEQRSMSGRGTTWLSTC